MAVNIYYNINSRNTFYSVVFWNFVRLFLQNFNNLHILWRKNPFLMPWYPNNMHNVKLVTHAPTKHCLHFASPPPSFSHAPLFKTELVSLSVTSSVPSWSICPFYCSSTIIPNSVTAWAINSLCQDKLEPHPPKIRIFCPFIFAKF